MKISAVLVVKNEEKRLQSCLESLSFVDEIVVIDDGSTDKTASIAKKFTKKVFQHTSKGYVEAARNFALSKASGEWILLLDADESIPPALSDKLSSLADDEEINYVRIPRKNIIFSQWIEHNTGWWPDYQLRFFRKGTVYWPEKIHGQPEVSGKGIELEAKEELAIVHENYSSISQFIEKLDRYTTIEANEQNVSSWEDAVIRPGDEFISRFFAREGYKDGLHGLMLSSLEAFYSQIVFAKKWEKEGFYHVDQRNFLEKNFLLFKKIGLEYEYWYLSSLITQTKNPIKKLRLSAKRRRIKKSLQKVKKGS